MTVVSRTYQLLLICVVVLIVYYTTIFGNLCFLDDTKLIFFDTPDASFRDFLHIIFVNAGYYRPLLFLTFVIDNYLWMLHESFMHLENTLLHLGNTLLLFSVTERVLLLKNDNKSGNSIPLATALLFALHPLTTESVNWISGRPDPLACLFLLASLLMLLKWISAQKKYLLFLSQFAFLLACLSKETAVFYYPAGLLLMFVLTLPRAECAVPSRKETYYAQGAHYYLAVIKKYKNAYIATTITTISYFVLRQYAAYSPGSKDKGMIKLASYLTSEKTDSSWWDKLMEVFKTIGFYSKKLFFPWPLNFTIHKVSDWYALLGIAVLIVLSTLWWKRRDVVAGLFISTFLLASSALLVSVGKLAWTPYAERYLYIPLVFFSPAITLWLSEKLNQYGYEKCFRSIMLTVCGVFMIMTVQRNLIWMDGFALYEDCYRKSPDFHRAAELYAAVLRQQGKSAEADKLLERHPKIKQKRFEDK